jgi:hypothetical protein
MAKKIKKLVVNADHFAVLEMKAELVDRLTEAGDGSFSVDAETLKMFAKIEKAAAKVTVEEPEEFVETKSKHGGEEE